MRLSLFGRFAACTALGATLFCSPVPSRAGEAAQSPLRILPLGDSITAGIVDGGKPGTGGYRPILQRLLANHGRSVVFVGTRGDLTPGDSDPWHDGWPGYVIRETSPGAPGQLYGALVREAIRRSKPDVILLMIGTNDFLRYEATHGTYSIDRIVDSMDLLIGEIFTVDPHVHVIVAPILESPKVKACYVERFDTGRSGCSPGVHPSIASVVKKYAQRGYAIDYAAGMQNAIPRDREHFPDGIHPAQGPGGYAALAQAWFHALNRAGFGRRSRASWATAATTPSARIGVSYRPPRHNPKGHEPAARGRFHRAD